MRDLVADWKKWSRAERVLAVMGTLATTGGYTRLHCRRCASHQGSFATIGRKSAVADFGRLKLTGAAAWWLWGTVHVMFLLGVRNRLSVILGWVWSYFTFDVGVRLITDEGTRRLSPSHTGAH